MDKIEKAIEAAGGVSALADSLGVSKQFIYQIVSGERPLPPKHCIPIERASGGEVTRYELRPDIFGDCPPEAVA